MTDPTSPRLTDQAILTGASWYPEMWPETEWPKDAARMREIGFNIVRLFEFAWHRFEPAEGQYDFAWARKVLDLCHEAGVQVMLGTPTAAPPAWLTSKYPEVLLTRSDGQVRTHGQRKHGSHVSAKYRELCRGIVGKMVEELADHPAVHSWQIDNEMSGTDYGPEAKRRFHAWLRACYGTIEQLNAAWGLEFWSQAYDSFEQIPMVTASVGSIEVPERHHPSLIMAIARFNNDMWTEYIAEQCEVIRAGSDKPITSNMTAGFGMHWYQHNKVLDRVGHSMYGDVEHYPWKLMLFDRMRAEKPAPYWLLETAPSWSAGGRIWNIHHDEHGIRAFTWLSHFLGGTMALYWQWREHWAGQEMLHGTLVTATGKWRPNRDMLARVAGEATAQGPWLLAHPPQSADVAVMLSNENSWAFSIDPTDEGMRYDEHWRDDYYQPLVRAHVWRDVIDETHDLTPYRVLIMPLMPVISADTRARLREWVAAGGLLLLGPYAGFRTEEFTSFTDQEFGGLEELMGAVSATRFPVGWVEDRVQVEFTDGRTTRTRSWCEGYAPTTGEARAFYRGGYGDGAAAVIRNQFGRGTVITLGCQVNEDTYLALVRELTSAAGILPVAAGSPDVLVVPRADAAGVAGYGVVNMTEQPQAISLPVGGTDLLTGRQVGPDIALAPLEVLLVQCADGQDKPASLA